VTFALANTAREESYPVSRKTIQVIDSGLHRAVKLNVCGYLFPKKFGERSKPTCRYATFGKVIVKRKRIPPPKHFERYGALFEFSRASSRSFGKLVSWKGIKSLGEAHPGLYDVVFTLER
jgi:hypothetical protein